MRRVAFEQLDETPAACVFAPTRSGPPPWRQPHGVNVRGPEAELRDSVCVSCFFSY